MVAKRLLVELLFAAAAGQQPAAKARRTGPAHCQDAQSKAISMPRGAEAGSMAQASAPTVPPTAPQAAALRRTDPWLQQHQKKVVYAEKNALSFVENCSTQKGTITSTSGWQSPGEGAAASTSRKQTRAGRWPLRPRARH